MIIILWVVTWIFSLFYSAFAITLLWSWFVVPLGISNITIPWAIGLTCLVYLFRSTPSSEQEIELSDFFTPIIAITALIGIGFIAHKFM